MIKQKEVLAEEKPPAKENNIQIWRECNIPENMLKDAFPALALALLQEYFLSGDTKQMIFEVMMDNLKKMNYSKEDIQKFKVALNETYKKFHTPNGFMG